MESDVNMVKTNEPKENQDISKWDTDIDLEAVSNSLNAGIILPRLKPELNKVYEVKIISDIKSFESDFGTTFSIDIAYNKMDMSLIIPKSFRFQLKVGMERLGIVNFSDLIGKELVFSKTVQDMKKYKNAELYNVQIRV